jgi:hypothetical protein
MKCECGEELIEVEITHPYYFLKCSCGNVFICKAVEDENEKADLRTRDNA